MSSPWARSCGGSVKVTFSSSPQIVQRHQVLIKLRKLRSAHLGFFSPGLQSLSQLSLPPLGL